MKVAVYCIALNEEKFIERWARSAKDADYIVVADTGSSDVTVEAALQAGCRVHIINVRPWRFDDARNASLALVPADADYCIALDADEILMPGWRQALEEMDRTITRPTYKYTWSWEADGSPGIVYGGDKIHARHGYRWKHAVHEGIFPTGIEVRTWIPGLEIEHHADNSKPRRYLDLLELTVREDPTDDRNAHYLARDLLFAGRLTDAAAEFKRHLSLPRAVWRAERAKSMRYLAQCEPAEALTWLIRASAEDPGRREVWVDLGDHYFGLKDWAGALYCMQRALAITERPLDYLSEPYAWGYHPHDFAAISAYHLGLKDLALEHGRNALAIAPKNEQLKSNMEWYEGRNAATLIT